MHLLTNELLLFLKVQSPPFYIVRRGFHLGSQTLLLPFELQFLFEWQQELALSRPFEKGQGCDYFLKCFFFKIISKYILYFSKMKYLLEYYTCVQVVVTALNGWANSIFSLRAILYKVWKIDASDRVCIYVYIFLYPQDLHVYIYYLGKVFRVHTLDGIL